MNTGKPQVSGGRRGTIPNPEHRDHEVRKLEHEYPAKHLHNEKRETRGAWVNPAVEGTSLSGA